MGPCDLDVSNELRQVHQVCSTLNGDHRVNQNPAITNQPSEADLLEALEHNEAERSYFEQIQNPQIYGAWIQTLKEKIRKATEQIGELEQDRFVAPGRVTACLSRGQFNFNNSSLKSVPTDPKLQLKSALIVKVSSDRLNV
jgi:hypothetical protein